MVVEVKAAQLSFQWIYCVSCQFSQSCNDEFSWLNTSMTASGYKFCKVKAQ